MAETSPTSRDEVLVGIASIPERAASLERVVAALSPQADRVVVSLNDYPRPPSFLDRFRNVEWTLRPTGAGNGGDAEKFAGVDDFDGYFVSVDDDVLYPADYVQTIVAGVERYERKAVVGFHGGKTLGWNGSAVAASHKQIRCLGSLAEDDVDVNVLGTGAMAFHTSRVPVWRDVFRHPNMADVHMACHAHTFGIPMVALAHEAGWLSDIGPKRGRRIYDSNRAKDGTRCDTTVHRRQELDRHDWERPRPARPRVRVAVATCSRPELLGELLLDLDREAGWVDLEVAVYEDPTNADYTLAREFCAAQGWTWHRFPRRLGRENYWSLVDRELRDARRSPADWFVFLPDDVRLVRHALVRAIATWQLLDDPTALTLWRLQEHEGMPNWTGRRPVRRSHGFEIFHLDGLYLCKRSLLEFFGYRVQRVEARPGRTSSGVGRAMSMRLHRAGRRLYRVNKSLARPVPGTKSVMNPDATDRRFPGVCL